MQYYLIVVRDKKKYYYTTEINSDSKEIIDWAVRFAYVLEKDISKITEAREVPIEEVRKLEKVLYDVWWKERLEKIERGEEVDVVPPLLPAVQLN